MAADTLIFKKKGRKFSAKIVRSMGNNHTPEQCNVQVNLMNYKDLALFFYDLKMLWNAPVDSAVQEYQKQKDNPWPF